VKLSVRGHFSCPLGCLELQQALACQHAPAAAAAQLDWLLVITDVMYHMCSFSCVQLWQPCSRPCISCSAAWHPCLHCGAQQRPSLQAGCSKGVRRWEHFMGTRLLVADHSSCSCKSCSTSHSSRIANPFVLYCMLKVQLELFIPHYNSPTLATCSSTGPAHLCTCTCTGFSPCRKPHPV
jgi:hypothetical protein